MYESNFGKDDAKFDQMHKDMYKIDQDLLKINKYQYSNNDQDTIIDHSNCESCSHKSECDNGDISITIKDNLGKIIDFNMNADMFLIYHKNKFINGIRTTSLNYYELMQALDTILDYYVDNVPVDLPLFLNYYLDRLKTED